MPDQNLAAAVEVLVGGASGTFLVCSGANALVSQKTASEVRTLLSVLTSAQIAAAYQPIGSYASSVHTHVQSDITGLVSALAAKASTSHKAEHVVGGSDAFTAADIRGVLGVTTLSGSNTGDQDLSSYLTAATATATYVALAGSYADPAWVTSLAWAKLTGVPAAVTALSGTNTGDQTSIVGITGTKAQFDTAVTDGNFLYVGDVTSNATHTGDATGSGAVTVVGINGTLLSSLATGILKNTTTTGVPSIAVAGDFPTLNQNTTGSAATLTTSRTINGVSFNGSANITVTAAGSTLSDTVPVGKGGTGLTSLGTALQVLRTNAGATAMEWAAAGGGGGTGDLLAANNLSDLLSAATARTNLGLGTLATQSGTFSGTSSGTNSGDNATNSLYSGLVTNATHTGDATGATALVVVGINGTLLSSLATGILKNTTTTGVPSIAVAGDFPTLNQNTTGTAAGWTTGRTVGMTGDVTWTSASLTGTANVSGTSTIGAGAVTLAKMADVATGTVFYRKTAATGVPEVQTLATLKTDLGLTGTNSGDQTITLTGNVTGSGTGSFATTIASLAVTNAMLAGSIAISKLSITGTPDATKFLRDDGSWQPQISSFNASTAASQTFAIGAEPSAATDVVMTTNITTGENLLYIPSAGATTRGLVTTGTQTFAGAKTFSGAITASNLSGTNTGDQTITLTGGVTGSGTGSFAATVVTNANLTGDVTSVGNAATIATAAITLAKMANVATGTVFYRKTAATGVPEVQTLATLKTDLGLTGTNSGDQTITLTGGVTGSGTGSFAATVVTNANLTGHVTSVGNAAVLGSFTKAQLNTAVSDGDVVYLDSVDTITGVKTMSGLNVILVSSSGLTIRNPANTFKYTITAGAIAADRVLTLPLTAGTLALTSDITGTNSGTNTGDQTITLTGDVTGSGTGSFAATIATAAVSLAKMANVATGTVFYRKTAATGVPEVQTLATLKTDLGLTGTNSGDQDLSSYLTSATAASTYVPVTRTLNALALSANQTFAVASTGTDFAVTSTGTTHTFAIPSASATARGLITTGTQTITGAKTFTTSMNITIDGAVAGLRFNCYNAAAGTGNQITAYRARGDATTSLYPTANDVIFGVYALGWDESAAAGLGAWSGTKGSCLCSAEETWTATYNSTMWTWATTSATDAAKANTNRMRIHSDGAVTIGSTAATGGLLELVKSNTGLTGFGTATNRLRFTDTDSSVLAAQPLGEIEFYSSDTSPTAAGVRACFGAYTESTALATAFVWGLGAANSPPSEVMRLSSAGKLGLGTGTTISAFAHIIGITEQLRLGYDASNYYSTTVSSAGAVTLNAVGASAGFTFSDAVTLSSTSTATGLLTATVGIKTTKTIYQTTETTSTPAAGAVTIDLTLNNHQTLSLTSLAAAGTSQVTFTPPTGTCSGTLVVKQHASASKDITTWAVTGGTIKWMGTEPNWVGDAATNLRVVSWRWDGSIMYLAATDVGT